MNVLHISDVHYSSNAARTDGMSADALASLHEEGCEGAPFAARPPKFYPAMLDYMGSTIPVLERRLRDAFAQATPDVVLLTGDLVDRGGSEAYRELAESFRSVVDELAGGMLPVVATPGNHDDRAAFRDGWPEILPGEGDEPAFFVREVDGTAFVSFDTSEAGCSNGYVDDARLAWLEGTLADLSARGVPAVVCTHHHLDPGQSDMSPCPRAHDLLVLLRRYNAVLFNGHTHHQAHSMLEGVPYYTADALSFQADSLDVRKSGLLPVRAVRFRKVYGYNMYRLEGAHVQCAQTVTCDTGELLGDMFI